MADPGVLAESWGPERSGKLKSPNNPQMQNIKISPDIEEGV